MMDARLLLAVALGSAVGGVARFLVGQLFVARFGPGFPYGTLFINVAGSFLIGVVAELAATRAFGIGPTTRIFLATGLLGGFTTFSTFSLDMITLAEDGAAFLSLLYGVGSLVLGFAVAYGGQVLARLALSSG
ncbi:MAG: fluoride efflux transporter CrcB [Candidatus Eremiobacteraeota bacterium]|nr:fluoride efflux transporter CrcB [Candidatus Eremiobacteraeota bacterium]